MNGPSPDAAAWTAGNFSTPAVYSLVLDDADRAELVAAAQALRDAGRLVPVEVLTTGDFALPRLSPRLEAAYEDVRSGRGFVVLRGLPRADVDLEAFTAISWGIGTYFGRAISQNAEGRLVEHVVDNSRDDDTPRMYQSAFELSLHNDVTAMLSLACWQPGASGGENLFASGLAIHDEIARRAPALLKPLYRGFHYHRLGEEAPGAEPYSPWRMPVFSLSNGQRSVRYQRTGYVAAHHDFGIGLTEEELDAADLFEEIARDPAFYIEVALGAGDMVVVNNYTVMHARRSFEDGTTPETRRRLVRYWFDNDDFRSVVPELKLFAQDNGIPPQAGRRCTYDFQKLIREAQPEMLGGHWRRAAKASNGQ
jgi:alpha-ketoglutarate-dependent taurine dioxygenase